jgi:hypothetical protein
MKSEYVSQTNERHVVLTTGDQTPIQTQQFNDAGLIEQALNMLR